jgi:hypothetical protein
MQNVRLWGKIQGSEKDYFIAEGVYDKGEDDGVERAADFETHGSGVNKNFYWACNSPLGFWEILPDISP